MADGIFSHYCEFPWLFEIVLTIKQLHFYADDSVLPCLFLVDMDDSIGFDWEELVGTLVIFFSIDEQNLTGIGDSQLIWDKILKGP